MNIKAIEDYKFPQDLKGMTTSELELLAVQIREFLIDNISETGGHLASNLGVVELSIALHKYFDTPKDKIVFDVGHQCYPHKILTGRAKDFKKLRKLGGLSGFPKAHESDYDLFDTGHSSTSISLMAGLSIARDIKGEDYKTVAVIGDGAMSGGLSYEALNNLGSLKSKSIIILNDNEMSIDKPTGGLENHLSKLRVSSGYHDLKEGISKTIGSVPVVGKGIMTGMTKLKDSLKYVFVDGVVFEELGFTYLGPCDGHNIGELLEHIRLADACEGPVVLHIITKKGKGYKNAEKDPQSFHGIGPFNTTTGITEKKSDIPSYSKVFGNKMIELAEKDPSIVAISAAMISGTGLSDFAKKYPKRTFDVGIAESYAVSFAAGLAKEGIKPVVAIYSTFLQRAYDNVMIDVCLNNLPVVFAIDRAGNVGADGETHHGLFDLSYLNHIPNLTILSPRDGKELENMLEYALTLNGPVAIRYPRGEAKDMKYMHMPVEFGAQVLKDGDDCVIWACGNMVEKAEKVSGILETKGIKCGIVDPRIIKPLDTEALNKTAERTGIIFTMEDNVMSGGFGEKIATRLCNTNIVVKSLCWPDTFIEQGSSDELFDKYGFNCEELAERIVRIIEN